MCKTVLTVLTQQKQHKYEIFLNMDVFNGSCHHNKLYTNEKLRRLNCIGIKLIL